MPCLVGGRPQAVHVVLSVGVGMGSSCWLHPSPLLASFLQYGEELS